MESRRRNKDTKQNRRVRSADELKKRKYRDIHTCKNKSYDALSLQGVVEPKKGRGKYNSSICSMINEKSNPSQLITVRN